LISNMFTYVRGNKMFLQLTANFNLHDENDEQEQLVNRNVGPVEEEPALQSEEEEVDYTEAEPEETEEQVNARMAGLSRVFQGIDLAAEKEEQKFVVFRLNTFNPNERQTVSTKNLTKEQCKRILAKTEYLQVPIPMQADDKVQEESMYRTTLTVGLYPAMVHAIIYANWCSEVDIGYDYCGQRYYPLLFHGCLDISHG
jgi:hypothetical protein